MGKRKHSSRDKDKDREERSSKRHKSNKEEKDSGKPVDESILGYSNDSNPFGDSNLTSRFVWHKKLEQEKETSHKSSKRSSSHKHRRSSKYSSSDESEDSENERREKIRREIEKARRGREERDREKRLWEEEMARMDRERNKTQWDDWENKEIDFHLEQAKRRSEIRIKEGRAKPIDWIYQWVMLGYSSHPEEEQIRQKSYPVYNPINLLENLSLEQLEELKTDINTILSSNNSFTEAYETILTICDYEIKKLSNPNAPSDAMQDLEIGKLLQNKSSKQLAELEGEIDQILHGGGAVDIAFWEAALKELHFSIAKVKLMEIHQSCLTLREKMRRNGQFNEKQEEHEGDDELQSELPYKRSTTTSKNSITTEDIMVQRESEKGMGLNEELFESEVNLKMQTYSWHDQYRPRKPKYYNRIKTGYEWNKYNQTHYDHDNPPPKIVQGYKFNLFYPDLIDPTVSPTFVLEKSDEDSTLIRFHAGPPYEDIAFRIVNREWELSHKKGYRCVFDKGVLQLWFNFKRFRYRR